MTPTARPSLVVLFFQLRDFWTGGAVERKRRVGAERREESGVRTRQRGACLIILRDEKKAIETI